MMLTLIGIVYKVAVALGAVAVWAFVCRRFFQVDRQPDSVCYVTTDDGWRLALSHYPAEGESPAALPVLLCPGLGLSGAVFDLAGDFSLARHLCRQGHDVWVLDPRGKGRSSRPRLWGRHPRRWRFDDYVDIDLPAAATEVCRRAGSERLHILGFGLGGLAALCVAGGRHEARDRIASCVALGATAFFGRQARDFSPRLLGVARFVPVRALLQVVSPLVGRLPFWPLSLLANLDNVDPATLRRTLVNAFDGLSGRELQQLASWHDLDQARSAEGQRDYRELLAGVSCPVMLVLAPRDRLAPAATVQRTFDGLGVEAKALLFAGREGGLSSNYGHLDLLIGRSASRDLYPRLTDWLDGELASAVPEASPGAAERWIDVEGDGAGDEPTDESFEVPDDEEDDLFATDPAELAVGDVPNIPRR